MTLITSSRQNINWDYEYFSLEEIIKASEFNKFVLTKKLRMTLEILGFLRSKIRKPIIITDACRFSGKKTSQHYYKHFNALDVWVKGYSSVELMRLIEKYDLGTGRGLYPFSNGFCHIDCRRGQSGKKARVSRWYRDVNGVYHVLNKNYFIEPFNGFLNKGEL